MASRFLKAAASACSLVPLIQSRGNVSNLASSMHAFELIHVHSPFCDAWDRQDDTICKDPSKTKFFYYKSEEKTSSGAVVFKHPPVTKYVAPAAPPKVVPTTPRT